MGLVEMSLKWRFAYFLMFCGFILMIAAVASSYMAHAELIPNRFRHVGFWHMCDDTMTLGCQDMVEYVNSINENPDFVYGCRAMVVLGLILEGIALCVALWMAYMASGIHIGNLISAAVNVISIIVSLIGGLVFLGNGMTILQDTLEMDSDPSWSFAVLIIAQGFYGIAAAMLIYEACSTD